MRLAIISDIHGNLPALDAVFASLRAEDCDEVVCLGDIVGYGARPNECVDRLLSESVPCILGNHDAAAVGKLGLEYMNSFARTAMEWTMAELTPVARQFLTDLPMSRELTSALLIHSSPNEPEAWHYVFNVSEASVSFRSFSHPVCFIGHTHFPAIFTNPADGRRLINVGSVGQPRDRDPRACYGVLDDVSGAFRWMRIAYPIADAARQIIAAGLPPFLAQRLTSGI